MSETFAAAPLFFHVDLDAFYASVEQHDDPRLNGKPVIVGGDQSGRGVVSACSYEARAFGVHSAMPAAEAVRLCPHGIFLPVRMERYQEVSQGIMQLLYDSAPAMQQISVDEAFLDMSGTERLLGSPVDQAMSLKRRIRREFGLAASVGIARSRFVAKMASDFRKPDGLHEVREGEEADFVAGLHLKELWGLGKKTRKRLNQLGIHTIRELRSFNEAQLRGYLGESTGSYLYRACRGIDPGIFGSRSTKHSISTETTFGRDVSDQHALETVLLELCEQVMYRVYKSRAYGYTVTTKLRTDDFQTHSRQKTLGRKIESVDDLYTVSRALMSDMSAGKPVRLIGVGIVTDKRDSDQEQPDLFDSDAASDHRKRTVEAAVWRMRDKLGIDVHKARVLPDPSSHGEKA